MLFDEALHYLLSLGHETLAIKLGLKNIERLLQALGQPQSSYPSVQIAGTNGKGSTAVMLSEVACASGLKTGLYTSPHLVRITERIRICGREIREEEFARLATLVRGKAEALMREGELQALPTFFEQLTAIALLAFKEERVQLAILETGLGGRLDATTAARAEVVAITPVAIDHQEYLGQTLSEIAGEKAAIIRRGSTAIIATQDAEALEVILKRCRDTGVEPLFASEALAVSTDERGQLRVSFETAEDRYEDVALGLPGRHQAVNAAVAIQLAEALRARGLSISRASIVEGIRNAKHAGRLELWEGSPSILFDGAHNGASARAFSDYLREFIKAPVTLVFGAMRDKELKEMAALLFPHARRLVLTAMRNPRAADTETLLRSVPADFDSERIMLAQSPADAVRLAFEATPADGLIAVTGSLYLVGEIRELLLKRER